MQKLIVTVEPLLRRIARRLPTSLRRFLGHSYRRHIRNSNPVAEAFVKGLPAPLKSNTVLYESFHGSSLACSPYAIFRTLLEDSAYSHLHHIWSITSNTSIPADLQNNPRVSFVRHNSLDYAQALAQAGTVISNSTLPTWYSRRAGQRYANTWHGVPLKRMFKLETSDNPTVHRNSQRNFLQTSHLFLPNDFTVDGLLAAADVKEACNGRIFPVGAPRVDQTLDQNTAQAVRKDLGVSDDHKIILIAPTWRGTLNDAQNQDTELQALLEKLQGLDPNHHTVFVQMHNFASTDLDGLRTPPKTLSTNQFLSAVDILITDYSSIMFDFLATGRPLILYAYDREEYGRTRGFNFALEELPATICDTPHEVMAAIEAPRPARDMKTFQTAKETLFPHEDGHATQRAIDALFAPLPERINTRPRLLIFTGNWKTNGITSSAINLLNALAERDLEVFVIAEGAPHLIHADAAANRAKLDPRIKFLFKAGPMVMTRSEHLQLQHFYKEQQFASDAHRDFLQGLFAREARRLFGDLHFDVAIDFSAYARFWNLVIGSASADRHVVYQHNDLLSEANQRFNTLFSVFANYSAFDAVVSVSEPTQALNYSNLKDYYPSPESAHAVRNLIAPERIREMAQEATAFSAPTPQTGAHFVTIGRLSPEKAHTRAIDAVAALRDEGIDVTLTIIGEGPLAEKLTAHTARLNLQNHILFAGQLDNPFPVLLAADCFLLSSDYEGQPMVLLEAMVLGKPIISTDIVGARSALEGVAAHFVPATDEGVAQGLRDFVEGRVAPISFDAETYCETVLQEFADTVLDASLPKKRAV